MKRLLISGSSGFVGSRLVEILVERGDVSIRALMHRPGSGVRISHLNVETVCGDICDPDFSRTAMEGVDVVVHLAYQNQPGKPGSKNATVEGTRVLAQAAKDARVQHFVHISTIGVFSYHPRVPLSEDAPTRFSGDSYCDDKIRAERWVRKVWGKELGFTILRFANVFGPFSAPWVSRPMNYLMGGRPVMVGEGNQAFSLLYVDHAVQSILCVLRQAEPKNEVYHISDVVSTVREYMGTLASWLPNTQVTTLPLNLYCGIDSRRSRLRIFKRELRDFLFGAETQSWLFRILDYPVLMQLLAWCLHRIPRSLHRVLRSRILGMGASPKSSKPRSSSIDVSYLDLDGRMIVDAGLYHLLASDVVFGHSKARAELGYEPVLSHDEAMELTRQWCEWAGLLRGVGEE